jgi:dihydroflavonol-4-reductase
MGVFFRSNVLSKTVILTGISGYIGLHCAKELLDAGFNVRGTIRDPKKESIVRNALALSEKKVKHLTFVVLDLTSDHGWDEAVQGCDYVMHVASPFRIANPKIESEMIEPAVEGTERVLRAAQQANVRRIVITGSIVSMMASLRQGRFGPDDWTDVTYPDLSTYVKSKTLAEKMAWNWVESNNKSHNSDEILPELVVIAPGAVFGPPLGRNISCESLILLTKMLNGKIPMVPDFAFPMVDVRDVAKLHVKALTLDEAAGERFIVAGEDPISFSDVAEILLNAGYKGPSNKKAPGWVIRFMGLFDREAKGMAGFLGMHLSADNSKTRDMFGWTPLPFGQSVLESARAIKTHEKSQLLEL